MTALAFKIMTTKRPSTGKPRGYRMVLAHINRAAYQWDFMAEEGFYVQSFAPCHRVTESGDYTESPTSKQVESFIAKAMAWHKFDRIIPH